MDDFHFLILITTIMPILAYLVYIYIRDEYKKEPIPMLLLAVLLGLIAAIATIMADYPELRAFRAPVLFDWWESISTAFLVYAIPAEIAKFLMVAIFLKFNKYYDEYVDAIVYSVCIALAFVGLKNGWFLFYNVEGQQFRGFMTALVLIPAHFTIGVVMGYFFGLARLRKKKICYVQALLYSILADGLFCTLFLVIDDQVSYYIIAIVLLCLLGIFMHSITHHTSIEHLISKDIEDGNVNPGK